MEIKKLKPKKALNKAFLKVKPNRTDIERFKANLVHLLNCTNEAESEEFHKNLVSDFLKNTYYAPGHFINTKGRNDLVIHNGPKADNTVGVILETKSTINRAEMATAQNLNTKAFQELVLYYLRERITHKNVEVKHLVITNIYEWFIFDVSVFEKNFAQNKNFVQQFTDFEGGRMADHRTDFFYRQIAEPYICTMKADIEFTYFDIRDYDATLRNDSKKDDNRLIALFKLLSPEHLLKLPFSNDSNSLDKRFYSELLHIIGLTETRQGGKKLISRKPVDERHAGSLLENAIIQLDSLDKIHRLDRPGRFGDNHQERLFNVALELNITWINRILFLKLLEAQLISYHKGDKSYAFLAFNRICNYDDLNSMFFQVLARRVEDRSEEVQRNFSRVPYLNSSLFEPTETEHATLMISNLRDDKTIPILSSTVLKDVNGRRRTGNLNALQYLFEFLNAYDFSSEGSEEIQEENKTLINASVLGLIFEKINGYKDGSFFTPGFITMYMCRKTIRRAVVQKFNETKNWNCKNLDDVYDKIDDRQEANEIVNSIKICDPAVGSGHFLVSALNEMIAIKSDLKILQDRSGKRLKEYHVEVVNDELIVTDEDGELFEYTPVFTSDGILHGESQRVQETLFHEKQTIIENCLFGVDINANSVKICRLRLWIELLKNAYYKTATGLETLPNIDINIKQGNSLVSRFAIDADLKKALKKSKWTIDSYRLAVATYRNAESKEQKREMERLISDIKSDFRSEISLNDPKLKKLSKLKGDLTQLTLQTSLFEQTAREKAAWNKQVTKVTADIKKMEAEIEEIKNNKIYENAFEWRFEFPEVLDEEGNFVGFDVVIGNPPYVSSKDFDKNFMSYLNQNYTTSQYQLELYVSFIEKGIKILKPTFFISFITPNSWLKNMMFSSCREFLLNTISIDVMFPNLSKVFEEASVDTLIFVGKKEVIDTNIKIVEFTNYIPRLKHIVNQNRFYRNERFVFDVETDDITYSILEKIRVKSIKLENTCEITRGVNPYDKYRGQTAEIIKTKAYHSSIKKDETFLPEIRGKHVNCYSYKWDEKHFISYGDWLAAPREYKFFQGSRIILRQVLGEKLNCTIIEEDMIIDQSVFIAKPNKEFEKYINGMLGVLASKLISKYFRFSSNEFDALFPKIKIGEFRELPIPKELEKFEKSIGAKVEAILKSKIQNPEISTATLETQIDQLVYQLYDLTDEEIAIIENSTK